MRSIVAPSRRLRAAAFLALLSAPAFAESGVVNLNVDLGVATPFTGTYGTNVNPLRGAAQAYGLQLMAGVDWQLAPPLAIELVGGIGVMGIPPVINEFNGYKRVYGARLMLDAAIGPRVRFLHNDDDTSNLWTSAHFGVHQFDDTQLGVDGALGYEFEAGPMSIGPFARASLLFDSTFGANHSFLASAGVSGSFDLVSFKKAPVAPVDTDNDGIPDTRDAAPTIPEDFDSFEDEDGAPEADNDNDGVLDGDDACPMQGGPSSNQGCPVLDRDGDGIPDDVDAAPNDPEDRDNFEDSDGAPEPDNDKDGILDVSDACPMEPGIAEERGCPAKDTDKDTITDNLDNCPTEVGPVDNQGCPVANKQLVVVTKESLKILDSVYFDNGKATIQKRSATLLDQVAAIIREKTWIPLVRIEGHTDDVGVNAKNQTLSEARAKAVLDYLVKKGVEPARLVAVGFGEDKPVVPNATAKGRSTNRRVEFNVVSQP